MTHISYLQVNNFQKISFSSTFNLKICTKILHDTVHYCIEKSVNFFDEMVKKSDLLKIIDLY